MRQKASHGVRDQEKIGKWAGEERECRRREGAVSARDSGVE